MSGRSRSGNYRPEFLLAINTASASAAFFSWLQKGVKLSPAQPSKNGHRGGSCGKLEKAKGPKIKKDMCGKLHLFWSSWKGGESVAQKGFFSFSEKASLSGGAKTSIRAPFDNQCIKSFPGGETAAARTIQWYAHL